MRRLRDGREGEGRGVEPRRTRRADRAVGTRVYNCVSVPTCETSDFPQGVGLHTAPKLGARGRRAAGLFFLDSHTIPHLILNSVKDLTLISIVMIQR